MGHVTIRKGSLGRGLFVRRNVKKGTELYEVPETMWFSAATVKEFSSFRVVLEDSSFLAITRREQSSDKVSRRSLTDHQSQTHPIAVGNISVGTVSRSFDSKLKMDALFGNASEDWLGRDADNSVE